MLHENDSLVPFGKDYPAAEGARDEVPICKNLS